MNKNVGYSTQLLPSSLAKQTKAFAEDLDVWKNAKELTLLDYGEQRTIDRLI
jgi:hypothetical protein